MGFLGTLVAVAVLVLMSLLQTDAAACDRILGPGGAMHCIQVDGYDKLQWGTCLTNEYLDRKSKGLHECVEKNSTYCWYQCMIEVHNKESGNVTDDCECSPTEPTDINTTLSHACFSPNGTECTWYRECLERKFPCREASDEYIIAYEEKMCNLYGQKVNTLSAQGARWLDATRRCLLVNIVPLLRPFESDGVTCSVIKSEALQTHAQCYLIPYSTAPSLCDLSASDFWTIFWGMRGQFSSYFIESMLGLIKVGKTCGTTSILQLMGSMRKLTVVVNIGALLQRVRRSMEVHSQIDLDTDPDLLTAGVARMNPAYDGLRVARQVSTELWTGETPEDLSFHRLAAQATSSLDIQLGWTDQDVVAFSYGQRNGDYLNVHILLADSHAFGLTDNPYHPRPNLTQIVKQIVSTVGLGKVAMTLDGRPAPVMSVSACNDLGCQIVYLKGVGGGSAQTGDRGVVSSGVSCWVLISLLAGLALLFARS